MQNSLNRLFSRIRESREAAQKRKKSKAQQQQQPSPYGAIVSGCCSRKTSSTLSHPPHKEQQNRKISGPSVFSAKGEPFLPDPLLFRVFDSLENPFELFPLRRVNHAASNYVQSKLKCVFEMDLRRVSFDEVSSSSFGGSSTSSQPETSIFLQGELWHIHPSGCKVLCRVSPIDQQASEEEDGDLSNVGVEQLFRLDVLVDEQWTSREIAVLCSLINEFRQVVRRISLDAPIFELVVANLASVDLDRWFAYQCFVKAVDECQMDMALNKLAAQLQQQQDDPVDLTSESELYWPKAKTILIRTTERESVHLARVLNYGVRFNLVMDRRRLDQLSVQVCVADANILHVSMAERPKQLVRNLYHFRCWAGSPGFDERFSQQWRAAIR